MKTTHLWLIAAVLLSTGCISIPTVRSDFSQNVMTRAAFELACPADQISMTSLNGDLDDYFRAGAQVGVEGCGRKAVYVAVPRTGWVLNSISNETRSADSEK